MDPEKLASASESSDPEVHYLLGERQTAQWHRDSLRPNEVMIRYADEQLAAVTARLNALGYK